MTLYYNYQNQEIRDLDDSLIELWRQNNNPKLLEWTLMPEKPSDNAVWDGEKWVIPAIEIPQTISARQIRLWLIQNGFQLSQIDEAINSIEDILIRETVKIEWEYAPYVERTHPWLVPLAQSLSLNEQQIDQAFIEASTI
jgi:hypothetical protein